MLDLMNLDETPRCFMCGTFVTSRSACTRSVWRSGLYGASPHFAIVNISDEMYDEQIKTPHHDPHLAILSSEQSA